MDIAVAGLIGVSSIASLIVWNPQAYGPISKRHADDTQLRDLLTGYLETDGLVWLQGAAPHELCERLLSLSNATLSLSATINSVPCGRQPPTRSMVANLTVEFDSEVVVLEAWYTAKG